MAQAVIHRPITAEARVRFKTQAISCETCRSRYGSGTAFFFSLQQLLFMLLASFLDIFVSHRPHVNLTIQSVVKSAFKTLTLIEHKRMFSSPCPCSLRPITVWLTRACHLSLIPIACYSYEHGIQIWICRLWVQICCRNALTFYSNTHPSVLKRHKGSSNLLLEGEKLLEG